MTRLTRAAPHLSLEEVKKRMRTDPRAMYRQRWLIIYNALVEPRCAKEIARHCGVSTATVHAVISSYNRLGIAAVETAGKGGRRHQYLTLEQEKEFLAPFLIQARAGEIATVAQIWHAFEQYIGHPVDDSSIYRLLSRHGWRKLMPRPKHPQADPQVQEQFKKTSQNKLKLLWPPGQSKIPVRSSFWPRMKGVLAGSAVPSTVGHRQECGHQYRSRSCGSIPTSMRRWLLCPAR